MRRFYFILPVLLLVHVAASAQTTQFIPRESIAETVIGWMRLHDFTGARKPLKVDDKLYSPAQLSPDHRQRLVTISPAYSPGHITPRLSLMDIRMGNGQPRAGGDAASARSAHSL